MECKCTILNQHSSAHMGINRYIMECKYVSEAETLANWLFRINRYIMECKFHVVPSGFVCNSRINRYIMECKLLTGAVSITTWTGINRYIMECKLVLANLR